MSTVNATRTAAMKQIKADYKAGHEDILIKKTAILLGRLKNLHKQKVWLYNLNLLMGMGLKYETVLAAYMELQDPR